jgi:hypothetical protein
MCALSDEDYAAINAYEEQKQAEMRFAEGAEAEVEIPPIVGQEVLPDAAREAAPFADIAGRTFMREEEMPETRFEIGEEVYAAPGSQAALIATIADTEKELEEAKSSSRTLKLLAIGAGLTAAISVGVAGITFYLSRRKKRRRRR